MQWMLGMFGCYLDWRWRVTKALIGAIGRAWLLVCGHDIAVIEYAAFEFVLPICDDDCRARLSYSFVSFRPSLRGGGVL